MWIALIIILVILATYLIFRTRRDYLNIYIERIPEDEFNVRSRTSQMSIRSDDMEVNVNKHFTAPGMLFNESVLKIVGSKSKRLDFDAITEQPGDLDELHGTNDVKGVVRCPVNGKVKLYGRQVIAPKIDLPDRGTVLEGPGIGQAIEIIN